MKNGLLWLVGIAAILLIASAGGIVPGVSSVIAAMAAAIQKFEGWAPGSRSYRNNNPGNIRYPAGLPGQVGADTEGHAIFRTFQDGWNALIHQLQLAFENRSAVYNSAMSLTEFFSLYAEENSGPYAVFVANELGVSPDTRLKDLGT